ncbi:EVI5-like protein isoform X2 [Amphiura filiformis]|uniref:EVI5-like protein isoform X2 n=1 Tax=Amphiura filiformis TaxID=82378 RepID=UPI003B20CEB3
MATAAPQSPSTPTNPKPTHTRNKSDIDIKISLLDNTSSLKRNGVNASQDSVTESTASESSLSQDDKGGGVQRSQSEPTGEVESGDPGKSAIEKITASTEAELLAKLEQQNKLLEADAKSLKSLTDSTKSSRRGSNSSLRSTSSNTSNMSNVNLERLNSDGAEAPSVSTQDKWLIWGKIVNDWEEYSKKKSKALKELVRLGIPHHFRGIVWQLLCDAYNSPLKEKYIEYLKMQSPYEKVIRRDIARTYPEHDFFKEKDGLGQETLFNVMKAYSLHDREVGYCQGCGFIVGLLLMQMPEEEAFCVLVKLMQDYRLRELFKPSMAELGLCMYQLECMIQDLLPELHKHFTAQSFHTSMYGSSWFLTLFAVILPISLSCRIMDVFISEGMETIFRVGIAILQLNLDELLKHDMEEMLRFLQKIAPKIHEQEPELLMSTAYQVRYNAKKMKKLEKEYLAFKTKETEDQVEMRRLRTENRLLRQRIEILEKENEQLADKLIQGQLLRAQEAEETYTTKRELETVKQSDIEKAKQLDAAQTTIHDLREKPLPNSPLRQHYGLGPRTPKKVPTTPQKIMPTTPQKMMPTTPTKVGSLPSTPKKSPPTTPQRLPTSSRVAKPKPKTMDKIRGASTVMRDLVRRQAKNDAAIAIDGEAEGIIMALQEELIAVRLREAESAETIKQLNEKMRQLERAKKKLEEEPGHDVKSMQEELIAVKLREAEANLSIKELRQKVSELEEHWQRTASSRKDRNSKPTVQALTDELMSVRLREADAVAEIKEMRQRIMELQTSNQMTSNQMRRIEEERVQLSEELDRLEKRKEELQSGLNEASKELCKLEAKSKEEMITVRLRETEANTSVAELKNRISELEIQNAELRTTNTLAVSETKETTQELQCKVIELEAEVSQLKRRAKRLSGDFSSKPPPEPLETLIDDDTMESFEELNMVMDSDDEKETTKKANSKSTEV